MTPEQKGITAIIVVIICMSIVVYLTAISPLLETKIIGGFFIGLFVLMVIWKIKIGDFKR